MTPRARGAAARSSAAAVGFQPDLERVGTKTRRRARKPNHLGKRDPVGREDRDRVALLEERLADVEDRLLGSRRDEDVLARAGGALLPAVLLGDGVAQGRHRPRRRCTSSGPSRSRRCPPGRRSPGVAKSGSPMPKVHDVDALRGQRLGGARHGGGRGGRRQRCDPPGARRSGHRALLPGPREGVEGRQIFLRPDDHEPELERRSRHRRRRACRAAATARGTGRARATKRPAAS